ncbi:M48 family metallopeptidase [Arachnia propionica]|uniref:M48 family peptidase n=1 Tax=Arachnia propionica TaxID=1750 RepID=A0A3P1WYE1_9ACTN|nr:SprT family zinc-dependent metalloprotease [Arachnia propionica]RRD50430.1 M48 family peptidase [Arachnia propionica]
MQSRVLTVADLRVEVTVKRMKNLRMRVPGSGPVVAVSAPVGTADALIRRFVTERQPWIERQRTLHVRREAGADRIVDDGAVRHWGRWLRVVRSSGLPAMAALHEDVLHLSGPDDETVERELARFRAAEVNLWASRFVSQCVPRMQVPEPSTIRYRQMRTRWGSCNHRTRTITLNVMLARYPVEALEYVVVHELAHLRHPNHGPDFWDLVASVLPDHRSRRRLLRTDGGSSRDED